MAPMLDHITDWVFDLDNTLYPAGSNIFAEMDKRMSDFVARYLRIDPGEAFALQKAYYAKYGTTLKGMMTLHQMPPDEFLFHVHEVDLSPINPCDRLRGAISALPGKKYIYTNGSRRHAERVTKHMGLDHLFDGMSGIDDHAYHPKPHPPSYDAFCSRHDVDPTGAIFFEDLARNLLPAHQLGFTTVLVQSAGDWTHEPESARPATPGDEPADHIHYVTTDLAGFLESAAPHAQKDTP